MLSDQCARAREQKDRLVSSLVSSDLRVFRSRRARAQLRLSAIVCRDGVECRSHQRRDGTMGVDGPARRRRRDVDDRKLMIPMQKSLRKLGSYADGDEREQVQSEIYIQSR